MAKSRNLNLHRVSRRNILHGGVLVFTGGVGFSAAGMASTASSGKMSQSQAGYKSSASGDKQCDKCQQFQAPSACKIVDGSVSPSGTCNFFTAKSK